MQKNQIVSITILSLLFISGLLSLTSNVIACKVDDQEKSSDSNFSETVDTSCENFGFAKWRESNGQQYLFIYATDHYTLGKLLGQNLAPQILTMDYVLKQMIISYNLSLQEVLFLASIYNLYIPEENKQEMMGISDAIPLLSYEDILMQRIFLDLYYGILVPSMVGVDPGLAACTAITARNSKYRYSIGQTMDFGIYFKDTLSWVKYKIPGNYMSFMLFMGSAALPIGKSQKVSCTLNLVQTWKLAEFGIPTSIKAQIAFENSKSAENFLSLMCSSYCASWNYIVADHKTTITAETAPSIALKDIIVRGEFGVKTNTYTKEQLIIFLLNPYFSVARQAKAEELTQNKLNEDGKLSAEDIIHILSYYDGTDASITRYPSPADPTLTCTLAFYSTEGMRKGSFGLGNPKDNPAGKIPL